MIVEAIRYFFGLKKAQISLFSKKFTEEEQQASVKRLERIHKFAREMAAFYLTTQNWRISTNEEEKKQVENLVKKSLTGDDNELETIFQILGVEWEGQQVQFEFREDSTEETMQEEVIETLDNPEDISIFEETTNVSDHPLNPKPGMIEIVKEKSTTEPKLKFSYFCGKYDQQIGFSIFDLPLSFDKCYQTYLTSKCEICHERADKNDFGVCLTCGMLLCTHACKGMENQTGKKLKKVKK